MKSVNEILIIVCYSDSILGLFGLKTEKNIVIVTFRD
jgi:hypothetical protein